MSITRVMTAAAAAGLMLASSHIANAENAGERAAQAAKEKYAGMTLTLHSEAGLQELGWELYNSQRWKDLTGITIVQISAPTNEMFVTSVQDFRGPANFDMLDIFASFIPDLAEMGAIVPLNDWMDQYDYWDDYNDIAPAFRDWGEYKGQIWGLPDDGDVQIVLYRKDMIEDPDNQAEFKAQYGYDLGPPADWQQWDDVGTFFTDKYAPEMYGAASPRVKGLNMYPWADQFRDYGGRFFDPETMNCTWNSDIGVRALTDFVNQSRYAPPGSDAWGFVEAAAAFLNGTTVLTLNWPATGRWAQNIGNDVDFMSWVPPTTIEGKVGYAVPPGGTPSLAGGYLITVTANSKNKEAAYLFGQWSNSKEVSLGKTIQGFSLRDPFRMSHYSDPGFRNLWSNAGEYLDVLRIGGENGVQDLTVIQAQKYHELMENAIQAAISGEDVKSALDESCEAADRVTKQVGIDKQKDSYAQFRAQANAYR